MPLKAAVNGTGRIGLIAIKILTERADTELVAINTTASLEMLAYLLKYDTVHRGAEVAMRRRCGSTGRTFMSSVSVTPRSLTLAVRGPKWYWSVPGCSSPPKKPNRSSKTVSNGS